MRERFTTARIFDGSFDAAVTKPVICIRDIFFFLKVKVFKS